MNAGQACRIAHQIIKSHAAKDTPVEQVQEEIFEALHGKVHLCVARECANEARRRANLVKRVEERKARKEASKFGLRGQPHRRITHSHINPDLDHPFLGYGPRECLFHATKGWRTFRVTA